MIILILLIRAMRKLRVVKYTEYICSNHLVWLSQDMYSGPYHTHIIELFTEKLHSRYLLGS